MFDVLNSDRIRSLRTQAFNDDRPEAKALAEFFIAYPRCHVMPSAIGVTDKGAWAVHFTANAYVAWEIPAAIVALEEISSLPAYVPGASPMDSAIDLVRQEVAELRRLNLWGVQQ